MIHTFISTS